MEVIDDRTIGMLEAGGFTHIKAACASCGAIVQNPFLLLKQSKNVTERTTMAELRRRYRCRKCGAREALMFAPWRQGNAAT